MKITRTSAQVANLNKSKQIANIGCNVCPCCGETKSHWDYCRKGIYNKGLSMGGIVKNWCEGIFKIRYMQVDCYSCHTCGATWESEPYQWA